MDEVLPYAKVE